MKFSELTGLTFIVKMSFAAYCASHELRFFKSFLVESSRWLINLKVLLWQLTTSVFSLSKDNFLLQKKFTLISLFRLSPTLHLWVFVQKIALILFHISYCNIIKNYYWEIAKNNNFEQLNFLGAVYVNGDCRLYSPKDEKVEHRKYRNEKNTFIDR